MIPGLYSENETNFSHNGLGLLADTIYCYPEEVRNGSYEIELAYPIFSQMYKEIKANRWIKAKANDRFDPQLFRIYFISKPINGKITVKAEHISYLLKDNFIEILNYTGNCNGILNNLNTAATFSTGFNFYSDAVGNKSFNFDLRNFWECIIGKDDSVISQFGTGIDIVRNNKNISLLSNGGQDNNVLIAYKKNLTGFNCEENWTGCITKIYPYATKDNNRVILPEKYINSQFINRDPNPRIAPVDFTNEFVEGEEITPDALRQKAMQYFVDTQCDIPTLNYNIEFVALSKTEEYKNFALNESIALLDYVIVRHELYGVDTKIKVVKAKYDTLAEKYLKLELGVIKNTITKLIKNTNKKIDDTKKELKEDIQEVDEKTEKYKVIFEARENEIELSVTNLEENTTAKFLLTDKAISEMVKDSEFESYRIQTAREISQKVATGEFGSLITQHYNEIVQAIVDATGTHTCTFNGFGLEIQNGGFRIKNQNGDTVFWINSNGIVMVSDLYFDNQAFAKDSNFAQSLANMESISLTNLGISGRLTIDESDFYIYHNNQGGYDLEEYVKTVCYKMLQDQGLI